VVDALLAITPTLERPEPLPLVGVALSAEGDEELTVLPGDDHTGLLPRLEPVPPPDRRRRRRWILAALAAVLVLSGGGVAAAMLATNRAPTYPVPDVSNKSLQDALDLLQRAQDTAKDVKWNVVQRREYSRQTAKDGIMSQTPGPQTALKDGGTVTLVISNGQPLVNIPPVAGRSAADATALLEGARLVAGAEIAEANETVPAGTVLTVKVGDTRDVPTVPEQTVVDLVVSSGPAPRNVPDVTGKPEADAKAAIEAQGLATTRSEVFSDTVPAGSVTGTSPPAGTSVKRGDPVNMFVSKGQDLVTVPDVTGQRANPAIDALQKAGLNVTAQFGPPNGKVLNTSPAAGTKVKRNTNITIYFQP
jgi:serine/threonine-protein kinase